MSGAVWLVSFLVALQSSAAIPMRTIDKGTQSRIDEARTVTVRSPEEWATLWRAHAPDKPPPPVDFTREMVVGVFIGTRPTAGYAVEIVGARQEGDALVVEYRVGSPARDAITAQILTTPYHLVAMPKSGGEVRFEKIS